MLRGLSVCQLDATLSPIKMAKPIEVLFVLWTWVHPSNHVLGVGGGLDNPSEEAFWGRLLALYRDYLAWAKFFCRWAGSSDAGFCCQYCNHLLPLLKANNIQSPCESVCRLHPTVPASAAGHCAVSRSNYLTEWADHHTSPSLQTHRSSNQQSTPSHAAAHAADLRAHQSGRT